MNASDPFNEQAAGLKRWRTRVLGARFEFTSDSDELLDLAREAFAHVPQHGWPQRRSRTLHVRMNRVRGPCVAARTPPAPRLTSGAGLLCSHVDEQNFVVIDPRAARALVQVGDAMWRHPRLLRYEFIEFAALTLASRALGLVPLHAGCVGARGKGILLLGASGSGKSTLALHAALEGLEFLAEDSVFVQPATLRATGLPAYAHSCDDALRLIDDRQVRRAVRGSPRIRRRSGVRKREIDLRSHGTRLAASPLRVVAIVVLSPSPGRGASPLARLTPRQLQRELRAQQPYATAQPGWREFERRVLRTGGFRLGRISPREGVSVLRELLRKTPA